MNTTTATQFKPLNFKECMAEIRAKVAEMAKKASDAKQKTA